MRECSRYGSDHHIGGLLQTYIGNGRARSSRPGTSLGIAAQDGPSSMRVQESLDQAEIQVSINPFQYCSISLLRAKTDSRTDSSIVLNACTCESKQFQGHCCEDAGPCFLSRQANPSFLCLVRRRSQPLQPCPHVELNSPLQLTSAGHSAESLAASFLA